MARDLLGLVLVHNRRGVRTSGVIVEVEAYIGESDPACHAAPGPTRRNAPLSGVPGHAYVYLNYLENRGIAVGPIAWGPRIGIRVGTESPWRGWIKNHPAVSATGGVRAKG